MYSYDVIPVFFFMSLKNVSPPHEKIFFTQKILFSLREPTRFLRTRNHLELLDNYTGFPLSNASILLSVQDSGESTEL